MRDTTTIIIGFLGLIALLILIALVRANKCISINEKDTSNTSSSGRLNVNGEPAESVTGDQITSALREKLSKEQLSEVNLKFYK